MTRKPMPFLAALAALALPLAVPAGDLANGKAKAEFCAECHEPADYKGEKAAEIEAWIRGIIATGKAPSGKKHKKDLAERGLSDKDIKDIAAYFASGG